MARYIGFMMEEDEYQRLRVRVEKNGGSSEDEVCRILKEVLSKDPPPPYEKPMTGKEFVEGIRKLFEPIGGVDLEIPPNTLIECPHCNDRRHK